MKIAFFDAKPYDKPSFDKYGGQNGITFKYFETKLNEDTVDLAHGYDGVCAFVNDTINSAVIDKLCEMGISVLALRCAGFNNVDMRYAFGKLHVMRVPAYSPYAVAEHAIALLLTSIRMNRRITRSKSLFHSNSPDLRMWKIPLPKMEFTSTVSCWFCRKANKAGFSGTEKRLFIHRKDC